MKTRMLLLAMLPCFLVVGCGMEAESTPDVRAIPQDPCVPEDCLPADSLIESDCPPGTELVQTAECIEAEGECVWDYSEACVPVEDSSGGEEPPPPDDNPPPPPPSEQPPRPIRPRA